MGNGAGCHGSLLRGRISRGSQACKWPPGSHARQEQSLGTGFARGGEDGLVRG
jgi:hypothetical protein